MEIIYIEENNTNSILYLENDKCFGYQFTNNTIKSIDSNILNKTKLFSLSNNFTKLTNEIYLDNNTGLKHYCHNGIENINKLFLNNGISAISYLNNNNRLENTKMFLLNNQKIICTLAGLLIFINLLPHNIVKAKVNPKIISNYELSDIYQRINDSSELTDKEKTYLYNPEFINDILPYINDSYYLKYRLNMRLNNIDIETYGKENDNYGTALGYYNAVRPSTLYIRDYYDFSERAQDTIAHEYVHLWQYFGDYNVITEACAEIISREYFDCKMVDSYGDQVKTIKELMEIIGPEPIWKYTFTGDFSEIEQNVRPYLTEEEYQRFLTDLTFDHLDQPTCIERYQDMKELLAKLYQGIYGEDIKDDEIISLIEKNDKTLVRYYFNHRYIDEEHSYFLDYYNSIFETFSYEEAIDRGLIVIYATSRYPLSNSTAFELIEEGSHNILRHIDYSSADIIEKRTTVGPDGTILDAIINGKEYKRVNLDDLVKEGIVKVDYILVNQKILTSEEYMNHDYPKEAEISIFYAPSTELNEDNVKGFIPRKTYLDTIYTSRTQESKTKTLTKKDE